MRVTPEQELVSVLIPAFNTERFVGETLESVRAQTYANLQIIVVDDGSSDGTVGIVERHAEEDRRILLLRGSHQGVAAARNFGLAHAKGQLVAQIDSDDLMHPERVERQVAFMAAHPELGFCASAMDFINERSEVVGGFTFKIHTLADLDHMIRSRRQISFTHGTTMMRKAAVEAVGGYDQAYFPCEDLHLFLRLIDAGYPGVAMPDRLLGYRLHFSSTTGSRTREQMRMKDFLLHNFYARRDGRAEVDHQTFLRHGSLPRRALARWREDADVLHSKARYRKVAGQKVRGNALLLAAVAMKAERFPLRALRALARKIGR